MKASELPNERDRKHAEREEKRHRAKTYKYNSRWPENEMYPEQDEPPH